MAYYYYGYDFPPTLVDHMHQRPHQHQNCCDASTINDIYLSAARNKNLFHYLTRQKPRPEDYPNQPDVDIRDAFTEYIIDMEVPGMKNPHDIKVVWTTSRSLVISGNIEAPESGHSPPEKPENPTGDAHGNWKEAPSHEPELLVSERKLGPFRRHFSFPEEVNMEKLTAKLEAGLLNIRVPKKGLSAVKTGRVNVQ